MGGRLDGSGLSLCMGALMPRLVFDRDERGNRGPAVINSQTEQTDGASECDSVIAEFIRTRGITRCPTACVLPTQGSVDEADRAALEEHASLQERSRRAKAAARARFFWSAAALPRADR
jgi:hypothetical protein